MEEGIDIENNSGKHGIENGYETPNSNERLIVVKGESKIPSRYLSARVPSCHDNCKYGIQHSIEAKPWIAARRKYIASGRKSKVSEEILISVAGRKKSTSLTSNLGETETVMKDQLPKDASFSSDKTLLSLSETDVSMYRSPLNMQQEQSKEHPFEPVQESPIGQTSREAEKSKSSFSSGSKNTGEGRSKQIKASPIDGKRRSLPTSSPLPSKHYAKKSSSTSSKTSKNLKEVPNLNIQKNVEEVKPEPTSNDNLQGEVLNVVEPTTVEKAMESTLACDPTNKSSVSPSLGDKILEQDSKKSSECGSPESSKTIEHGDQGIHATKSLASSAQSSGIANRRMQKATIASSSLPPLSQSASSRRIFKHGNQGNNEAKSRASFPEDAGIKVYRKTQNTKLNVSSNPTSLSRPQHPRMTFKQTDNGYRRTASLKVKRQMQHTLHKYPSFSSLPSARESLISRPNSSQGKQQDGATLKRNKTGNQNPVETVKVGFKIRPRMSAKGGAGDKVNPAHKLTFRRGRVIELQPQNNVSLPRRLKFRPARLLSDAEREKYQNRKWKEVDKGESNDAKTRSGNDFLRVQLVERSKRQNLGRKVLDGSKIDGSSSGPQQVVLRHQNLLGKQVTRRLYNNVIEETATKLAELRKSKVKALVGAFETVISLDSRSQVATTT